MLSKRQCHFVVHQQMRTQVLLYVATVENDHTAHSGERQAAPLSNSMVLPLALLGTRIIWGLSLWIRLFWELRSYWLAVNAIEMSLFAYDKKMAEMGGWRISEDTILFWALLGGTPGAYFASRLFRHKHRKNSFMTKLHGIVVVQVAAAVLLAHRLYSGN